jgi:hypothetical protein
MTHRLNLMLLALLVLVALPGWWWLLDNPLEDVAAKPLTVASLRQLAASVPGQAPVSVEMDVLTRREEPATLTAAGSGLRSRKLAAIGHVLPVPGQGSLVIQPAADPVAGQPAEAIDAKAVARFKARASEASLILTTRGQDPAAQDGVQAVAPGVVVIPAAAGRMIFVRLADGREVLFAGDIAPQTASWLHLRAASRWRSQGRPPEIRRDVHAWLRTLRKWRAEAPGLVILPGEDLAAVRVLVARNLAVRRLP